MDDCKHHDAIEREILHLKDSLSEIRRMFVAILVGLVMVLAGLAGNYHTISNGHTAVAHAKEISK